MTPAYSHMPITLCDIRIAASLISLIVLGVILATHCLGYDPGLSQAERRRNYNQANKCTNTR